MPRVVRDSDEDVESKSSGRRTRASSAVSSVTDSPATRRTTRSNKLLSTIESSPESLDDSNVQRVGRSTRSRTATLDKATSAATRSLKSRKNSVSSDHSESITDFESEVSQRRVTRKTTSTVPAVGTPTKTNLRSRGIRAGSEAKSTPPPSRSKRVTRASSVDPVSLNESIGTPVKRHTRASMVPMQPTVAEEEQESKAHKSLNNNDAVVGENDSESVTISKRSTRKSKVPKEIQDDIIIVSESINVSEKPLEMPNKLENSLINKSDPSCEMVEESAIKSFAIYSHDNALESSISESKIIEIIDQESPAGLNHDNLFKKLDNLSDINDKVSLENVKSNINILNNESKLNDDEIEFINVEDSTESTCTDDYIIQIDSPEKDKDKLTVDNFKVDIKNAYVKLNRTREVENILNEKTDEFKGNVEDSELITSNNENQNSVITNAKTAIILVNDFVKNNDNLAVKLSDTETHSLSINNSKHNINQDLNDENVITAVEESSTKNLNLNNEDIKIHTPKDQESVNLDVSDSNIEVDICSPTNVNVFNNEVEKSNSCDKDISDDQELMSAPRDIIIKESSVVLNDLNNDKKYLNLINKQINKSENDIDNESKTIDNCEKSCDTENNKLTFEDKINNETENLILVDVNSDDSDHFMDVDVSNVELENSAVVLTNDDKLENCVSVPQNNDTDISITANKQLTIDNLENPLHEQKYNDELENIILIDEDSSDIEFVEAVDTSDIDMKNTFNLSTTSDKLNIIGGSTVTLTPVIDDKIIIVDNKLNDATEKSPSSKLNETKISIHEKENLSRTSEGDNLRNTFENNKNNQQPPVVVDIYNDELVNPDSTTNKNEKVEATNSFDTAAEVTPCSIGSSVNVHNSLKISSPLVEDSNSKDKDSTTSSQNNTDLNNSVTIDQSNSPNEIPDTKHSFPLEQIDYKLTDLHAINENIDITSTTNVETTCKSDVDIDENGTELVPENGANNFDNGITLDQQDNPLNHSNSHDETESFQINSETNQNETKLCEVDKNSLSSAVTDADGESASSLQKLEQTKDESLKECKSSKSPKEQKEERQARKSKQIVSESEENDANVSSSERSEQTNDESFNENVPNKSQKEQKEQKHKSKSKTIISESEENEENLFQDVLPEEYTSKNPDESIDLNKGSTNDSIKQTLNDSLKKKNRRSLVETDESINKTVIENVDVNANDGEGNRSLNKSRQSANKSLEHSNSSLKPKSDESISELSDKSRRSLDKSVQLNKSTADAKDNKAVEESSNKRNSLNKSRKSLDKSNSFSQSMLEVSHNDSASQQLDENKSLNKSRKSLDKEVKKDESLLESKTNESISEKLSTSLNDSKSSKRQSLADKSRKSLSENKFEELVEDEPMDVDEPMEVDDISDQNENVDVNNKSLNKSRQSLDKSQHNKSKNDSISEKLSASLNSSKISKRLSLENSKNNSSRRSNIVQGDEQLSISEDTTNESLVKNRKSLTKASQSKNASIKELSVSLHDFINDKSLIKQESIETFSDNGAVTVQKAEISLNKSNLLNESSVKVELDSMSSKKKDKTLLQTSLRKSLNKSVAVSSATDSSDSEIENGGKKQKLNKSGNKSLNASKNDRNFANTSLTNFSVKASIKENGEDLDTSDCIKYKPSRNDLNDSIKNSIERMKYSNPIVHNISTVAEVDSESDDENQPQSDLNNQDSEESENEVDNDNTDSEDDNEHKKSIDSDIAREYNLAGKDDIKYSDDDVAGDVCRASEEEFSDTEDEGDDLADFVVPDDEVEDDDSEDSDVDVVGDDDNEEDEIACDEGADEEGLESADEEEMSELETKPETSVNISKKSIKDKSFNDSKSQKNRSDSVSKSRLLEIADLESDDDGDDEEVACNKSVKDNSANSSSILKNKSLNNSKIVKDKSNNLSKSILSTSTNALNNSKLAKNKRVTINEVKSSQESDSESEEVQLQKLKMSVDSSECDSSSENGDSYRIITSKPINLSEPEVQNKKLIHLIECSTPKPGITKKNAKSFVDKNDSLSIVTNKSSISTRRKSGSLDNLIDTKLVSSRFSIGSTKAHDNSKTQTQSETIDSPEAVLKNRQSWKLVPLSKTVQLDGDETPVTKFLKKERLNDSVPVLQSMKSGSLSDTEESKKPSMSKKSKRQSLPSKSFVNTEDLEAFEDPDFLHKKKRKLGDISHIASLDDESMIQLVGTKKKRARIEESINQDGEDEQNQESELVEEDKKKKKKKEKQVEEQEKKKKKKAKVEDEAIVEEVQELADSQELKQKKKKKNKSHDDIENEEDVLPLEMQKHKKKKCRRVQEQEELEVVTETAKPNKKKSRTSDERSDQENCNGEVEIIKKKCKRNPESESKQIDKKSKKKKKIATADSDNDEAPEEVGFEDAKSSALIAMQQATDGAQVMKQARKKKHHEHVERMHKQESIKKPSLKRLSDEVLDGLTEEPFLRQAHKRQKLSKNRERNCMMPSTSMFSPGKPVPANLKVDDDYIELSGAGGTTQFGVVNLAKATKPKVTKSSIAALTFREKMLARNQRQPMSAYHMYLQKQKAKSGL